MKIKMSWSLILLLTTINGIVYSRQESPIRDPFKDIEMTQRLLELRRQQEYRDEQLKYPLRNEEKKEDKLEFKMDRNTYLKILKLKVQTFMKKKLKKL